MRPAGVKSNNEIGFRQDSIEYLDRNRAKTLDDKRDYFDTARRSQSQSGRLVDTYSTISDTHDFLMDRKLDFMPKENYHTAGRASSTTPDIRSVWNPSRKPQSVFDLHNYG